MYECVLTSLNLSLLEFLGHFCRAWPLKKIKDTKKQNPNKKYSETQTSKHCARFCHILYTLSKLQVSASTTNPQLISSHSDLTNTTIGRYWEQGFHRDIYYIPLESQRDLSPTSSTCWLGPSTSGTSFFSGFQTRRSFWRPQRSPCELSQTHPLSNAFSRHTLGGKSRRNVTRALATVASLKGTRARAHLW